MAKRGSYLGGSTIIKMPRPSSKGRKVTIGALELAAAAFAANPPEMFPVKASAKPRKRKKLA